MFSDWWLFAFVEGWLQNKCIEGSENQSNILIIEDNKTSSLPSSDDKNLNFEELFHPRVLKKVPKFQVIKRVPLTVMASSESRNNWLKSSICFLLKIETFWWNVSKLRLEREPASYGFSKQVKWNIQACWIFLFISILFSPLGFSSKPPSNLEAISK